MGENQWSPRSWNGHCPGLRSPCVLRIFLRRFERIKCTPSKKSSFPYKSGHRRTFGCAIMVTWTVGQGLHPHQSVILSYCEAHLVGLRGALLLRPATGIPRHGRRYYRKATETRGQRRPAFSRTKTKKFFAFRYAIPPARPRYLLKRGGIQDEV